MSDCVWHVYAESIVPRIDIAKKEVQILLDELKDEKKRLKEYFDFNLSID